MLVVVAMAVNVTMSYAAEKGSADEAVAMVKKAGDFLKKNGKEKAFATFNDPKGGFVDRDLYIFAFGSNGDGVELANGGNARMVGKNVLEMRDADGQYLDKNILAVANSKEGHAWLEYKWVNPVSKVVESKKAYIERFGDILLGCGVYQ
jgi:signal transduction histidine kinase